MTARGCLSQWALVPIHIDIGHACVFLCNLKIFSVSLALFKQTLLSSKESTAKNSISLESKHQKALEKENLE